MFRIRGEQKFFEFLAVFCSNIAVFFKLVHFKRETDRHGGQESKSVLEWNEKAAWNQYLVMEIFTVLEQLVWHSNPRQFNYLDLSNNNKCLQVHLLFYHKHIGHYVTNSRQRFSRVIEPHSR